MKTQLKCAGCLILMALAMRVHMPSFGEVERSIAEGLDRVGSKTDLSRVLVQARNAAEGWR